MTVSPYLGQTLRTEDEVRALIPLYQEREAATAKYNAYLQTRPNDQAKVPAWAIIRDDLYEVMRDAEMRVTAARRKSKEPVTASEAA